MSRATTYGYSLYELQVTGIDPNNKKQYYSVYANMSAMRGSETKYILGVTLSGESDNTFHA